MLNIIKKVKNIFTYAKLIVKTSILLRRLIINELSLDNCVIIEGTVIRINWTIQGCYRIKIHNLGNLTGDSNGASLILKNIPPPITITFYGILQKKTKELSFSSTKITVAKFHSASTIPKIQASFLFDKSILHSFSEPKMNFQISANIESALPNAYFKIPPFNKTTNY